MAELKAEGESQRGIAAVLGVDERTVRRELDAANAAPEETGEPETRADTGDGDTPETDSAANAAPPPNALDSLAFAVGSAGG